MCKQPEALRLADALNNLEATGACSDSVGLTEWSWKQAEAAAAELRLQHALIAELVEALHELADLMDAVRSGNYEPDSFTTQPARAVLSKAKERP